MEIIDEFADDLATQVLGSQPKYLAYSEIPEQEIAEETAKVTEQLKEVLNKAPESSHENIIAGKLNAIYYSKVLLESMPYLLSNEGATVGEVWNEVEKETERTISVVSARVWQCK